MDTARVTGSTPAQFKLCGSPPALHIAPEQSGAGFGEHQIFVVRSATPFRTAITGRGPQTPARFYFPPPTYNPSSRRTHDSRTTHRLVKPRLEPEEALSGPLYFVAILLVAVPAVDFLLSVPAVNLGSVQWRFAAVGLLSGFMLTPILGLSLAFVIASVLKHHGVQRSLVIACLTIGLVLLVMCIGFLFDALQLRVSIPSDGRAAFNSAWHRALIKHALTAVALLYLGWGARRMIPTRASKRGPKPVHVVSK